MPMEKLRSTIAGERLFARAAEYDSEGNLISQQFEDINAVIPPNASFSNTLATMEDVDSALPDGRTNGDILAGMSDELVWDSGSPVTVITHNRFPTETIGDKSYRVITMPDNKVWMAENLDLTWDDLSIGGSYTYATANTWYYDNDEASYGYYGKRYGIMYNAPALTYLISNTSRLIPGWHVPTQSELTTLCSAMGISGTGDGGYGTIYYTAGTKLKSTTQWNDNGNGTDDYGFKIKPTGRMGQSGFEGLGSASHLWLADVYNDIRWTVSVHGSQNYLYKHRDPYSKDVCYVRLIKD